MAVYNKQNYVAQAIESVIHQTFDFKKNIQIILVNDKSTDNTSEILEYYQKKYPQNIKVITNEKNMGPAFSRSSGLEYVRGKYVNFCDSDDYFSKDAFSTAFRFLEKNSEVDIASVPIHYFGVKRGPHNLNFKYETEKIVNLAEKPEYIQLSGASAFFRFEKLKKYHFNENLRISEDALLINQMLLENPLLGCLSKPKYFYRKDGTQNSLITSSASTKSYFTTRIDEYFFKLIEYSLDKTGEIPKFIQYVLMYDLQWIVEIRKIDKLLEKDELKSLYDKIIKILSYVDESVILNQLSIPAALKAHVILIKRYGWDYLEGTADIEDNFKLNTLFIDNFRFKNDYEIEIDGILTNFTKNTKIFAEIDGKTVEAELIRYPQRDNYSLNFIYGFNHNFKVTLNYQKNSKISFKTQKNQLNIEYSHTSRLNDISGYELSKNHIAVAGDNEISIIEKSVPKALKLEYKTLVNMLTHRSQGWVTGVVLRALNIISYPFYRNKRIWIFMDLPGVAGDNGLELFRYVNSIDAGNIKSYFVLEKSPEQEYEYLAGSKKYRLKRLLGLNDASPQYTEIRKIGKVLPYRSIKHRLYTLFSEFIITSHPDNTIIYPFWGNYPHVAGLSKSKTVFLQHGVTKDNVSEWLNEFDKPLEMLVTVSDREKESFKHPDYGYRESIVKTLGFPRFDRLENDDKKEIVIMPSWRRQLDQLSPSDFVKTNFYNTFNELLSDSELIDFITENGYKLVFKPHRNLHKFIDAFTTHPDVTFDLDLKNYSETFNRSSLIVTDYSSISFDFAYLKKPIIYYHFDNNYHFDVENGYFKYESDGFGPVCRTHQEIKECIIGYVENTCEMEEVYKKRVDEFFKYRDKNNSKRVYEEICKLDTYY